jgi:tetratricopeptide (TPR) repeat protein
MLLLALAGYAGAAEPLVAVVEVTHDPDPEWRKEDLRLLDLLREALASRSGLRSMPGSELAEFFKETPETPVGPMAREAREHLKRGRKASGRLKPRLAIQEYSKALRILRAIFPYLSGLTELEDAHLQLGMTYQALGKTRKADEQYRMVLLQNPKRVLDEALVSPAVINRFNKVRDDLLTALKGSISLLSEPTGSRVYMDGRAVGYTPITVSGVVPGEHYFSIEHNGYQTWFGILPVKPSGMDTKEVFLTEGRNIKWVRLLNGMAETGIGKIHPRDAQELANYLKADWLVFASISHLGSKAMLELGIFLKRGNEVSALGIFPGNERSLNKISKLVHQWIKGDRRLVAKALNLDPKPPPPPDPDPRPPPPPNGSTAWYQKWWVWTIVGVVAAGATTGTVLWLSRDSGIHLEAYR